MRSVIIFSLHISNSHITCSLVSYIRPRYLLWKPQIKFLSYVVPVKSKVKISQNFVTFSEYMNFNSSYFQNRSVSSCIQLLSRAFRGKFVVPEFGYFCKQITELYHECKSNGGGKVKLKKERNIF